MLVKSVSTMDKRTQGSSKPANGRTSSNLRKKQHAPLIQDPRFARLHTDPRFLKPSRDDAKVALDDRFKSLLSSKTDQQKKFKGKLDKYGRKNGSTRGEEDDLHRLYKLQGQGDESESDKSSGEESGKEQRVDYARGEGQLESSSDESESEESSDAENSDEEVGADLVIGSAAARRRAEKLHQELDGDEEEFGLDDVDQEQLADLDAQAERTVQREQLRTAKGKIQDKPAFGGDTERLAVVNMDWDHIRAIDLYKVFSSQVSSTARASTRASSSSNRGTVANAPANGRCFGVRIYPSEFGRKRMAQENKDGPPREIFKTADDGKAKARVKAAQRASRAAQKSNGGVQGDEKEESDDSDEDLFDVDEGGDFDEEALRSYQLDRLRYYYAIATFDSPETARFILSEIDGTEMEHTANTFDLSFVPKDMTFPEHEGDKEDPDDDGWRDEATELNADAKYDGVDFTTDALRHSRVKLTWDADDPQRSKITRQLMSQAPNADQLRDDDFKAYLASASEDSASDASEAEGDEGGKRGDRMRALLGLNGDNDAHHGAFGKAKSQAFQDGRKTGSNGGMLEGDMEITFMPGLTDAAARRRKGEAYDKEESTIDKYKRKQREKRERRKKGDASNEQVADDGGVADEGFDDPFFASDDEEIDFDSALAAEQARGSKRDNRKSAVKDNAKQASQLPKSDDVGLSSSGSEGKDDDEEDAGHFSLKDIVKAEQAAKGDKKKSRWAKKKEKKQAKQREARNGNEIQPGFAMDVGDQRFSSALFDDHRFALDPSHPSFVKTNAMQKLVEERRNRHQRKETERNNHSGRHHDTNADSENIGDLVKSVKKRNHPSANEANKKKKT